MNELQLIKKVNWKETFQQIDKTGQYSIEVLAEDVTAVRSAIGSLNNDCNYRYNLSAKFEGNTAIITAEEQI